MDTQYLQTSVTQQWLKILLVILQVMMVSLTLFVALCERSCQPITCSHGISCCISLEGETLLPCEFEHCTGRSASRT